MDEIYYSGNGRLTIGDIENVRTEETSDFDRVITVCQENVSDNISDEVEYSYYNMSDGDSGYGGECTYEIFEEAADELYEALENGERVLIHCHVGRSRSVSVSMAALGRLMEQNSYQAFYVVKKDRKIANPNKKLLDFVDEYTGTSRRPQFGQNS